MPKSVSSVDSSPMQATLSQLALALDRIEEAVVWTDAHGRIQWCNAAFEQLVGATSALAGQPLVQVLPLTVKSERLSSALHPVSHCLATNQELNGQYGFSRHDRSFRLTLTVTPLPDVEGEEFGETDSGETGSSKGVMVVIRDIMMQLLLHRSLQKTALELEEAVRSRTAELSRINRRMINILESITDGFYTLDENWCFTYLNHQAEQILQRSRVDLLGKNIWASFPQAVNTILDSKYHQAVTEQCSVTFEVFYPPLNAWFETRAYPIAQGLAVYFRDFSDRQRLESERQQAEAALRKSELWFRNVFNTTAVGMVVMSPEGVMLQANAAYCRMIGYTRTELLTKTCQQIVYPDDFEQGQVQLQQLLAGDVTAYHQERRYFHKHGHIVWGLLSVSAVRDEQQQVLYVVYQIQDITDRKQAEADLRESEQRFRSVFNTTAVGMVVASLDGAFMQVNAAYCQMLGYTEAELLTRTFHAVAHPDDLGHNIAQTKKVLTGELSAYHIEKRYLHKKGHIVWGLMCLSLVCEAQQPLYFVVQVQDITDRKQAELALQTLNQELEERVQSRTAQLEVSNQQLQAEIAGHKQTEAALRKSEEWFRTMFDNAPIAISLADVYTYHVLKINQAHHALFGYSDADLATMTYMEYTHPDDVALCLDLIQQLLDGSIPRFQIEKRFCKKDGTWIWANLTVTLLRNPDGSLYSMGMIEDITARKQTEAALQLTQFSIDRAADPVWWVQPDGSIYYVNDSACRDLGYPREAIIGKQVSDFNPDWSIQDWQQHWRDVKKQGSLTFETRLQGKDGMPFPIEATANYVAMNNKEYYCSFVRNITAQKQAEEQLKASLKEKEILLKEIHHRVKNNLQTVYSLLSLQANALQDPQLVSPFKDSQYRVKAMALIHEKLYQSENLANINFNEYVQRLVADLVRSYSTNPAIHVAIEIAQCELAVDIVLPCGLMINELISNALKYAFPCDRGGTIQISFAAPTPQQYRLVIADDGVGLPEDIVFSHDISSLNTLGLQLVHAFVRQLQGTITLDCTGGSRFEILFPPAG
ncbi:PAS domain S-box protein [Phormidium sp. FACHB-592]|uniref:PAS domain S-box protein n=1 Tax=Stenomitos frigidus AS-A4 TaxID=2933935 RepID=A0ABV0KSI2_9CYAN|nr:PAS domain S-box protein [Phormidium sp. FACHB-592]MBD2075174.1 PAS domain S-box protein [Phormidium sp. FACHB-592]